MNIQTRTYECDNSNCANYRVPLIVTAQPIGQYLAWPNVRCICHREPPLTFIDGQKARFS